MFSRYGFQTFFKPSATFPVAPVITGIITHFVFHIRCIAIHKLLYFGLFSASFYVASLFAGIATFIIIIIIIIIIKIMRIGVYFVTALWAGDWSYK